MDNSQPPAPQEEPDPFAEFGTPEGLAEFRREGREAEKARRRRQVNLIGLCAVKMSAIVIAILSGQLAAVYVTGLVLGDAPDLCADRVAGALRWVGYVAPFAPFLALGLLHSAEGINSVSSVVAAVLVIVYLVLLKGVALGTWLASGGGVPWHGGLCVIASLVGATLAGLLAVAATRLIRTCEELDANRPPR